MTQSSEKAAMQSPIIFTARGLKVDTRLRVFDQEFHVHSTILKLGSAFFNAFLDSPQKEESRDNVATPSSFAYEWVTELDQDWTGWSLVESKSAKRTSNMDLSKFEGDSQSEIKIFHIVLSAIYHEPYEIFDKATDTLRKVVNMADYYRALPAVSKTLSFESLKNIMIEFLSGHYIDAATLLRAASKLRHRNLFESIIVIIAGDWSMLSSDWEQLEEFSKLARNARARILELAARIHQGLFQWFSHSKAYENLVHEVTQRLICRSMLELPEYYRLMYEGSWSLGDGEGKNLRTMISPLIEKNQKIICKIIKRGTFHSYCCFLCGEVRDEEIPWDMTQKDW